jgi:hypothetical protein
MGTDVLALHVRSLAEAGGNTYVASSWTIYKELAASYPEVLEALCHANWPIQVSVNAFSCSCFDSVTPHISVLLYKWFAC